MMRKTRFDKKKNPYKYDYYKKVWDITMDTIKYKNKPKNMVIDHIVPIIYGYKNKINPKYIGGNDNLQYLKLVDNLLKNTKLTKDAINILNKIKDNDDYIDLNIKVVKDIKISKSQYSKLFTPLYTNRKKIEKS